MRKSLKLGLRGVRRSGGFAVSVALRAVGALVLVPATIHAGGLQTWSSIVLGQSLALIAATALALGYPLTGPAAIATKSLEAGVAYYRFTGRVRLFVALPCYAIYVGAVFTLPNPDPVAGLIGSAYVALGGFGATYYFIGRAEPSRLFWADTVPRVVPMFAAAIWLGLGGPLLIGLALPALGALLAIGISNLTIRMSVQRRCGAGEPSENLSVWGEIRDQIGSATSVMLRAGREALPVLMLTPAGPELVGVYGVFDRVIRQANNGLYPVAAALQGWVPRRISADFSSRPAVVALLTGVAAAASAFLLFITIGMPLVRWLSSGKVTPSLMETVLLSTAIALSMLIRIVDTACLVPLGSIRAVMVGNIVGIVALLVVLPVAFALNASVVAALTAVVVAYVTQLLLQLIQMKFIISRLNRRLLPAQG